MGVSKRTRRRMAGFSLVEALIAAGVLGVALTALVRLHQSSIRGTVASARIGDASEVARQIADHFSIRAVDTPLGCPNQAAPIAALPTCAAIYGTIPGGVCNSVDTCDPLGCTFDFDVSGTPAPAGAGPPLPGRFRVRLVEGANPAGEGFRVAVVVCWNDPNSGGTRTVVTDRLSVPGL